MTNWHRVSVPAADLEKSRQFSVEVLPTLMYGDNGQKDPNKVRRDSETGKRGEYAAYHYLTKNKFKCTEPDCTIYIGKKKSWAADLFCTIHGVVEPIAVKTCKYDSLYGEWSWSFQSDPHGRYDPILNDRDNYVMFVREHKSDVFCVTPPIYLSTLKLGDPIKPHLQGLKKIVWTSDNDFHLHMDKQFLKELA